MSKTLRYLGRPKPQTVIRHPGHIPSPQAQRNHARGFTLVELVMVIALAGVIAVMISTVMSRPIQGFVDQSRRAELVDLASGALNRMARDVRLAVPNSLVASGNQFQMLSIAAAGRYRANQPEPGGARQDPPACPATGLCAIDILSPIAPASSASPHWLIIYNTSAAELAAAVSPSVISPKAFTWNAGSLSASIPGFRFKYASPQHRFFLANEVVGYRCDSSGRLWRAVSPNLDGSGATESLVVNSISACSFSYASATNTRSGLLTIRLSLTQNDETITLLQQVHVDNAP
jgi:MSHA biogenesis protein MshO